MTTAYTLLARALVGAIFGLDHAARRFRTEVSR